MVGASTAILKRFKKRVTQQFPDAKILLFGSRARGDALHSSDYDILVVSSYFSGHPIRDMEALYMLWDEDIHADILAYTPEKFAEWSNYISIAGKAKKEGILV